MIIPIKIDPLNMFNWMKYKCNKCGSIGELHVQNANAENWEEEYKPNPISCPECSLDLSIE